MVESDKLALPGIHHNKDHKCAWVFYSAAHDGFMYFPDPLDSLLIKWVNSLESSLVIQWDTEVHMISTRNRPFWFGWKQLNKLHELSPFVAVNCRYSESPLSIVPDFRCTLKCSDFVDYLNLIQDWH